MSVSALDVQLVFVVVVAVVAVILYCSSWFPCRVTLTDCVCLRCLLLLFSL